MVEAHSTDSSRGDNQQIVLVGPRVLLRALDPARDTERRRTLGVHPELARGYGQTVPAARELTAWEASLWFAKRAEEANPLFWVIDVGGQMAGTAMLHSVSAEHRSARYAVGLMDPALLGHGLGAETTRLVLDHAFGPLGLHRVDLRVLAFNTRAIACYTACGFREEGRERESCYLEGRWHDDIIMGVLEQERSR